MMQLFGLSFLLYFLKLSDGKGFWYNMRNSDNTAYRAAIAFERASKRLRKATLDLKFMYRCRDENLHPKFTRKKCFSSLDERSRKKRYRRELNDEIRNKNKIVHDLKQLVSQKEIVLSQCTTWMKRTLMIYAVNHVIKREITKIECRHERKYSILYNEKMKRKVLPLIPTSVS